MAFSGSVAFAQSPVPADVLDVSTLPAQGSETPIVTLVEYTDFQCPFCSRVKPTLAALLEAYPNEVRLVFAQHPLSFHKDAHLAAQASLAAFEQGQFWAYHDLLWANQKALKRENLEAYAEQLGLDMTRFNDALDSGKFKDEVDRQMATGKPNGISGTPSYLINGVKFVGAQPLDKFREAVDIEIARARALADETGLSGDALYDKLVEAAPKAPPKPAKAAAKLPDERKLVDIQGSPVLGTPEAPVTLVMFCDFEGPYCKRVVGTITELMANNRGKLKWVFKHHPLSFHKNARLAHRASIAAYKQGKFWDYHDILFANNKALTRDDFISYARQLGLDINAFEKDMDDPATDDMIAADLKVASGVSVRGTPHFFMNGLRISGAQPLDAFQETLDAELKIAQKYLDEGISNDELVKTIVDNEKPPIPEINFENAPVRGASKGKVVLVIYADFQCPFCKKAIPTLEALLEKYPNDLKMVYKQFPLDFHQDAALAAQAALAAHEQGKFWEYHDILFANQKALKREDLEAYALQLGLEMMQFTNALDSGKYKAQVNRDIAEGRSFGISGTPSFLINGERFVGAQPIDKFSEKIDAALKK